MGLVILPQESKSRPPKLELKIATTDTVDVVIAGGGVAGQSAARLLASCQRNVTLVDAIAAGPAGLTYLQSTVDDVERCRFGFMVHCGDGTTLTTRVLLLASDGGPPTPAIEGAEQFYGSSLHQCPYCDAWEHRDQQIGVLGADDAAVGLALKLLQWSPGVTIFTNGGKVGVSWERQLKRARIKVVPGVVRALEGEQKALKLLRFKKSQTHPCEALFFPSPRRYHSSLAERLGCDRERLAEALHWKPEGDQVIEGLFVAGRTFNYGETAEIAASEGLKAAKAANDWLLEADQAEPAVQTVERRPGFFRKFGPLRQTA